MTIDRSIEARATALLHERAARQALVDGLVTQSAWRRFVDPLFVSAFATVFLLLFSSAWIQAHPRLVEALLAGGLAVVIWQTLWLVQVTHRLHALTTVLQKSGVLSQFVAEARAEPANR